MPTLQLVYQLVSILSPLFVLVKVPLENPEETEQFLKDRNVSIPVIPLEYGDVYLANQSLAILAIGDRSDSQAVTMSE